MEDREVLERTVQELRDANRALVEEVRAFRQTVEDADKRRKRYLAFFLIAFYTLPVLALLLLKLVLPTPPEEHPWERRQREREERTEKALDRADEILKRWEKTAPPK